MSHKTNLAEAIVAAVMTPEEQYRYQKRWRVDRAHGITRYTDPTAARRHIATLLGAGGSMRGIADAAGTSPSVISRINKGQQKHLRRPTEAAILAVTLEALRDRDHGDKFVPDLGARRRIRALMVLGHSAANIAQVAGLKNAQAVYNVLHQQGSWITQTKHDSIVRAYRALATRPGASAKTRTLAAKNGYPGPLAWGDIDDPAAEPDVGPDEQVASVGRQIIQIEDVEWLLGQVDYTFEGLAARTGHTWKAIYRALLRAGRQDLIGRLVRNTKGMSAAR